MARRFSTAEIAADGTIHLIGVAASITGAVVLIILAAGETNGLNIAAVSIYVGLLILSFVASAIYNMWPWDWMREPLRRVDHAAIYLKIAGTYTPLVVLLGSLFGYILLGVIWAVALAAAAGKLITDNWSRKLSLSLYLGLGWAAVLLAWPIIQTLQTIDVLLMIGGGVLYSAGVIFFAWEALKFQNAIWHGFVLAASACFFAAISHAVLA